MTAPTSGPCAPWCTDEQVRACCGGLDPEYDLTDAIAFASAILFRLSGRQWPGLCEQTVWPPCAKCCAGNAWWTLSASDWNYRISGLGGGYPSIPYPVNGGWMNCWACGGEWDGCGSMDCLVLPGPIAEVTEVSIGGAILDPAAYVVEAYRKVCRVDGEHWPRQNHFTAPNGWYITYLRGKEVGIDGQIATAMFACQIAKNRCGAADCVLPQRLKQITREGVEMDFADPLEFIDDGKVGIYEVDLWLRSVNPNRLQRRARVFRADTMSPVKRFT